MGKYDTVIKSESLRKAYLRFATDDTITDQGDDLALLRAMCEVLVARHSDVEDKELGVEKIMAITNMLLQVDKLIKSITEREAKQKFLVHISSVKTLIEKISDVLIRHIKDPEEVRRIVADVTAIEIVPAGNVLDGKTD